MYIILLHVDQMVSDEQLNSFDVVFVFISALDQASRTLENTLEPSTPDDASHFCRVWVSCDTYLVICLLHHCGP